MTSLNHQFSRHVRTHGRNQKQSVLLFISTLSLSILWCLLHTLLLLATLMDASMQALRRMCSCTHMATTLIRCCKPCANKQQTRKNSILNWTRNLADTDLLPRISCWLRDIEAFFSGVLEAVCQFCWAWLCSRPSCVLIQLNICLPQSSEVNVICKCSKRLRTRGGTAVNQKLAAGTLNENQCSVSPKSAH